MNKWTIVRLLVLFMNVPAALSSSPASEFPIDWRLSLMIAPFVIGGLAIWLPLVRDSFAIQRNFAYRWDTPLFPIKKYPVQLWLIGSYSGLLAGLVGFTSQALFSKGNLEVSGFLLIVGGAALATLCAHIAAYSSGRN